MPVMRTIKATPLYTVLGILILPILTSCTTNLNQNSSSYSERKIEEGSFTRIKLQGGYNVKLVQGSKPSVILKTADDLIDKIKIEIKDQELSVETKVKNIGTDEVLLTITAENFEDIKIEGGVYLTTNGYIEVKNFNLNVEGGANIDMQIKADTFKTKASGGVNMEFEGTAGQFTAISEGAANIDADHLEAQHVVCSVSGVGNASVYAIKDLDAKVEGVGKIGYRGEPSITKKVDGIGLVYRK